MTRGEDWHQASIGGIAAKNNPQIKLINADLSKTWPCTISTCLILLVGEVNPQHAHSSKYKLYRRQKVVQHCRLWVKQQATCCYWNMQLHRENTVWLLLSTLKVLSSCLEKPWLWIILICFIRVLLPLSAGPDTNQLKTGDRVSKKQKRHLAMDAPTKHEDFHHIHLCPGMLIEVLLYFGALEFCLFALLSDILVKAHSHTDLRRGLGYIFRLKSAADGLWLTRHHNLIQTPVRLKNKCGRTCWFYPSVDFFLID